MELNRSAIVNMVLFLLVGVLVVGFGYRWIKNRPHDVKPVKQNTKVAKTTPTLTPTPVKHSLKIFAAGVPFMDVYPSMEVWVDGQLAKAWNEVKGNPERGEFVEFEFTTANKINASAVQVKFTNHMSDRSLYVDRISIDGVDYPTDSPLILSTFSEKGTAASKCVDGFNWTRWLRCNGYFTYAGEKVEEKGPAPTPRILTGTVIKVYAAGVPLAGVYPAMQLVVKGKSEAIWSNVKGDPYRGDVVEFVYTYLGNVAARDIQIQYTNDAYENPRSDRNLYVDRINVNGRDYMADAANTYSTGVYNGAGCSPGFYKSKWLSCNGYFQFDVAKK